MGTVIDFTAAVWRRVAALELEVAECRRIVTQAPPSSWRHKVYTSELIEAERRLSIAEGMRELEVAPGGTADACIAAKQTQAPQSVPAEPRFSTDAGPPCASTPGTHAAPHRARNRP